MTSPSSPPRSGNAKAVEDEYQKYDPITHVLKRSDMYCGPTEEAEYNMWTILPPPSPPSSSSSSSSAPPPAQLPDNKNKKEPSPLPHMTECLVKYSPAALRTFEEILLNAVDNRQRDPTGTTCIKVTIDAKKGVISVYNDGQTIPVVVHAEHKIYVPELVFGHLLSSSNYSDSQEKEKKRTTGGRFGLGAKLTNIFSRWFEVECMDGERNLRYRQARTSYSPSSNFVSHFVRTQKWTDNMRTRTEPVIGPPPKAKSSTAAKKEKQGDDKKEKKNKKSWTKVTYAMDAKALGIPADAVMLPNDLVQLMSKRVYDVAGTCMPRGLKVWLNGKRILYSGFKQYVSKLFSERIAEEEQQQLVYEDVNDRWQVGVISPADQSEFRHVSFVNGIVTTDGGTHVQYITDQVVKAVLEHLQPKKSATTAASGDEAVASGKISYHHVRSKLMIFVNCLIENPTYTCQMKRKLSTLRGAFGSTCILSAGFLKRLLKLSIIQDIRAEAEQRAERALKRVLNNKEHEIKGADRRVRLVGIPKLEDANEAGRKTRREPCTLILTEGDSAKAMAMAGLTVVGRDYWGVFPLKGKFLNVRGKTNAQLCKNAEFKHLCQIIGLQPDRDYKTLEEVRRSLRYDRIMTMCDADPDGAHITGLILNLFACMWPSLFKLPGFLSEFITPVVKMRRGTTVKCFYTLDAYRAWKKTFPRGKPPKSWKVKYYKGLGTNTSLEAKEYFRRMAWHRLFFSWDTKEDDEHMALAFSEACIEKRKKWLMEKMTLELLEEHVDTHDPEERDAGDDAEDEPQKTGKQEKQKQEEQAPVPGKTRYQRFIDTKMLAYSVENLHRSIPLLMDGLKPSQRKILHTMRKENIHDMAHERKVAAIAGTIIDKTAYHHGEKSLHDAMIGMAQDFMGANNLPLLFPSGQFGTRATGGNDAASPRYIHTYLHPMTQYVFRQEDDLILELLHEDNQPIEPRTFYPVVPLVLINGWSTSIPCYNPAELVAWLERRLSSSSSSSSSSSTPSASGASGLVPWYREFKGTVSPKQKSAGAAAADSHVSCFATTGSMERDAVDDTIYHIRELPVRSWTAPYKEWLEEKLKASEITDFGAYHQDNTVHFHVTLPKKLETIDVKEWHLESLVRTSNMMLWDTKGKIHKYGRPEDILEEFYVARLAVYEKRKARTVLLLGTENSKISNRVRFILEVVNATLEVRNVARGVLEALLAKKAYAKQNESYEYLLGMPISSLTKEKVDQLKRELKENESLLAKTRSTPAEETWQRELREFLTAW